MKEWKNERMKKFRNKLQRSLRGIKVFFNNSALAELSP